MNSLERTITSLDVAEMVGRRHDQVLRDIEKIQGHLADHKSVVSDYFIESSYEDSTGRKLPCFDITKKGCELYSTRMTGSKGTQFAVAYIERFNIMETHIKEQQELTDPRERLKLMYQFTEDTAVRVDVLETSVEQLRTEVTLNSSQKRIVHRKINLTVSNHLGGKKSNAYKNDSIRATAFSSCHRQIWDHFDISHYMDIPKVRFEEAMKLIPKWAPALELQARIDEANGSGELFQ